jgi:fumarate reductase flavoprotein subunit
LPPNWRGYGSSKRIEHPDTAARQQQVDNINQTYTDRFERQAKLMPYEDKLPEPFKGKNQRLGEC